MEVRKILVDSSKYSIKCPYTMNAEFVVVHNSANDAPAENEIKYMIRNNNEVSFHFAVDDVEVVQGIPTNRNTWNAGDGANGKGNRKGISIEICYSKSGGDKFIKAEQNAAKFIASILKEKGWGIDKVKKHQDFNGKYCPHRTLDMGWNRFLDMVKSYCGSEESEIPDTYIVQKGDMLITIAEKYGLNWTDIAKYNYIEDTRNIKIGTVLYLKNYAPIKQTPEVQETINRPEVPIIDKITGEVTNKVEENAAQETGKSNNLIVTIINFIIKLIKAIFKG